MAPDSSLIKTDCSPQSNRKTEKQIKPEKQKQKLLKPNTGDTDLNINMSKTL